MDIINEILKYKSVSIIGNYKNVGKTTTLNYIIEKLSKKKTEDKIILGLTSIGVDGEEKDVITNTKKPKIYVKKDSIIATAKSCVINSDITKEILEVTDINTPLGVVVIFKALSDGYIKLAGPSINNQIKLIINALNKYGATISIVDGALSRKSLASSSITEATIFCSGAVINKDINKVIEQISYEANLITMGKIVDDEFFKIYKYIEDNKVTLINKDYSYKNLNLKTVLASYEKVCSEINEKTKYVYINGIITNTLIEKIIKNTNKYKNMTLIVVDGTKIFVDKEVYDKFIGLKGSIMAINDIKLIGISINPTSIEGYFLDEEKLIYDIEKFTNSKVFNVMSERR